MTAVKAFYRVFFVFFVFVFVFVFAFVFNFFFFFQAEDGIRDVAVTGVQTCALPISWFPAAVAGLVDEANNTLN
mgnify:CR=1 FL=1